MLTLSFGSSDSVKIFDFLYETNPLLLSFSIIVTICRGQTAKKDLVEIKSPPKTVYLFEKIPFYIEISLDLYKVRN